MEAEKAVNLVVLTIHDFLFFASQDYGAVARPAGIIGSYSLMYAINREIPEVRRLVSGSTPHYDEDLPIMRVYSTPAAPTSDFPGQSSTKISGHEGIRNNASIGSKTRNWRQKEPMKLTWNSIGEELTFSMTRDRYNLPKTGAYYKHPPLSTYYFYLIGEPVPSLIRIGKKCTPARLRLSRLSVDYKSGKFEPTCPVTVVDLPSDTRILKGSLLTVPPAPVIIGAELDGEFPIHEA
ncbi:MAG: type I-D CRISPR-associated protein Cas5/Csc1 [Candidatus Thorarchaeota archaeon]